MNAIIDAALNRSRTVLSALALLLIAGVVTFIEIPKEAEPDVPVPFIYTVVSHRGISPVDAERLLVRPLEREMRDIEGVKEMTSSGFRGGGAVTLEFDAGFDVDIALADVREAVDKAKSELPADADEPTVTEINFSLFPILSISLSGNLPERTLVKIARDLKDTIEEIPSVLEVDIGGDREEQTEVIIDPVLLKSYNISADEFANFLRRNNQVVAAGELDTGSGAFSIQIPGLIEDVSDVLDLPIVVDGDAAVRVADVATGRVGFKDPDGYARVNTYPAVTLDVSKRVGENIIQTVEAVKWVMEQAEPSLPPNLEVNYFGDRSIEIRDMLTELQNNVITAVLLVMIVVVAALGLRAGLLVGVAIPGSFLTGILVLGIMGLTINMVVLFGLILAVGMLVDGAIVVTEYADRKMTEGVDRKEAYAQAAKRMAWPVIASTMTTLAAFMPLLFWTGLMGEFMKYLPLTLIATLSASLAMALIFIPTLGAIFGKPGIADPDTMRAMAATADGDLSGLKGGTGLYVRVLRVMLNNNGKVIAGAVILLFSAQILYWSLGKGVEFFPEVEPTQASVYIHARGNLSVEDKDRLTREVEDRIFDMPEFKNVYVRSGEGARYEDGGAADIIGAVNLIFTDWQTRRPAEVILEDVRSRLSDLAGVKMEIRKLEMGPPTGRQFHLNLSADNPAILPRHVEMVRARMESLGTFVDIEDTRPMPGIEWKLEVDRPQAAKFGLDISAIGDVVQLVTNGLKLTDYRPDTSDDEVDVVVRFPEGYRSLDQMDTLRVNTPQGPIPIGSFVSRVPQQDPGEVNRTDGQRVLTIYAGVKPGLLADDQVRAIEQWLGTSPDWDPSVRWDFKGEDQEQQESADFLSKAFMIALFLMAIILVTQFNSFYSAFLILTAVIMSTIGVFMGLLIFQQPFGIIMSGLGVISLAGIVVNNNIVLIDTYDRHAKRMADPVQAIILTGAQRLRPVLLTTITTVLGLMPMMFQINVDFVERAVTTGAPSLQWWQQLSIAIVCGLTFATALTLVFTPCALKARLDVQRWLADRKARKTGGAEALPAE